MDHIKKNPKFIPVGEYVDGFYYQSDKSTLPNTHNFAQASSIQKASILTLEDLMNLVGIMTKMECTEKNSKKKVTLHQHGTSLAAGMVMCSGKQRACVLTDN